MLTIFIRGDVPSQKNSKRFVTLKNGKKMAISSKFTLDYKSQAVWQFKKHEAAIKNELKDIGVMPYFIAFEFCREEQRGFDYNNISHVLTDMLSKKPNKPKQIGISAIKDDNADCIVPVFLPYTHDKQNAGVNIYFGTFSEIHEVQNIKWNNFFKKIYEYEQQNR